MKCNGNFIYKSIEKREGGEFTDNNGKIIKYNPSYIVKVDEVTDNGIFERKFKVPVTDEILFTGLNALEPYTKISMFFNLDFYNNQIKLTLYGFEII